MEFFQCSFWMVIFNVDNGGYGQKGCVIFKPDSISIQAGENYEVTITGWNSDCGLYSTFLLGKKKK